MDNMLKITGDGRKAALDMRLVDPFAEPRPIPRSAAPSSSIHARMGATRRDRRSTQLVFCDLSTPNPDRFNVYDEVRDQAHCERHSGQGNRLHPRRRDRRRENDAVRRA